MPDQKYKVRNTETGKIVTFRWTGDTLPTETEFEEVFAQADSFQQAQVAQPIQVPSLAETTAAPSTLAQPVSQVQPPEVPVEELLAPKPIQAPETTTAIPSTLAEARLAVAPEQEQPTIGQVISEPGRIANEGIRQILTGENPIAGLANIGTGLASTLALPFTVADVAARQSGLAEIADIVAVPFEVVANAVQLGQRLIQIGIEQDPRLKFLGLPEEFMRLGMSEEKAKVAAEAISQLNQIAAQFALPLGVKKGINLVKEKIRTSRELTLADRNVARQNLEQFTPEEIQKGKITGAEDLPPVEIGVERPVPKTNVAAIRQMLDQGIPDPQIRAGLKVSQKEINAVRPTTAKPIAEVAPSKKAPPAEAVVQKEAKKQAVEAQAKPTFVTEIVFGNKVRLKPESKIVYEVVGVSDKKRMLLRDQNGNEITVPNATRVFPVTAEPLPKPVKPPKAVKVKAPSVKEALKPVKLTPEISARLGKPVTAKELKATKELMLSELGRAKKVVDALGSKAEQTAVVSALRKEGFKVSDEGQLTIKVDGGFSQGIGELTGALERAKKFPTTLAGVPSIPAPSKFKTPPEKALKRIKPKPPEQEGEVLGVSIFPGVREVTKKIVQSYEQRKLIDGEVISERIREKDVASGREWIASPEFEFRKHPVAGPLVTDFVEAELSYRSQVNRDILRLRKVWEDLGEREQLRVTAALKTKQFMTRAGQTGDPVTLLPERLQKAASEIRPYFKEIKAEVIKEKREVIRQTLSEPRKGALADIESGVPRDEAFKNHKLRDAGKAAVEEAINDIKQLENWGPEDYVTLAERGDVRIVTEEGVTVAVGRGRLEAATKAKKYLDDNPDVKKLTLDDEFAPGIEFPTKLSKGQYFRLVSKASKALGEDARFVQNLLRKEGNIVAIKPTFKYSRFLEQRKWILKGEDNLFDILPTYAFSMRKKLALDPLLRRAKQELPKLPPKMRAQVEDLIADVKGRKTLGDKMVDEWLNGVTRSKIGALVPFIDPKPFGYSRGVNIARTVMSRLKLGWRPVAAFVNLQGGLSHTWIKRGSRIMRKGIQLWRTPEGKALVERNRDFIGMDATFALEAGRFAGQPKLYDPIFLFQLPERINRPVDFLSNYVWALEKEGLKGLEAEKFARKATRFQQFAYNMASLPKVLRGPSGRLIGQFKTYMVKEMEFISMIGGAREWMPFVAALGAIAGPRGMLYFLKSIPFLGVWYGLSEAEDYLNKQFPKASRGLPGTVFGVDIGPQAVWQFPDRPEEWLGPTGGDLLRFWNDIIGPAWKGEERTFTDVVKWLPNLSPLAYYWELMTESLMNADGWITDDRTGRLVFKPTPADQIKLFFGVPSLELSSQRLEARYLRETERIQRANRARTINEYLNAVKKEDYAEVNKLMSKLIEQGVTSDMLTNAARQRGLTPKLRLFRQLTKRRRAEEIERFIPPEEE